MAPCATIRPGRFAFVWTLLAAAVASPAWSSAPTSVAPPKAEPIASPIRPAKTEKRQKAESAPSSKDEDSSRDSADDTEQAALTADVEIFIPSIQTLVEKARGSCTAKLLKAFADLASMAPPEGDEGLDLQAALKLIEQVQSWPDTSVLFTVYKRDSAGRPRWALRLDWPADDLRKRLAGLIQNESARKALGDLSLNQRDGVWRLELPDVLLGVISAGGKGSTFKSAPDLSLTKSRLKSDVAAMDDDKPLLACRQAVSAMGINDLRYEGRVDTSGRWDERARLGWNPLIGFGIKTQIKRVASPYGVPKSALAAAAFNAAGAEGLADAMIGLPRGTIGDKASSDMCFAVLPGTGFLPVPDVVAQFNASDVEKIVESLRSAVGKDTTTRHDDDRPTAWREGKAAGTEYFWQDPSAREGGGLGAFSMRTVVFTERNKDSRKAGRLIVAQTSTRPDELVTRWRALERGKDAMTDMPSSKDAHWQARIRWSELYGQAQPYLSTLAAFLSATALPPMPEEIRAELPDSVVDVQVEFGGLRIRHHGPVPLGAVYVPATVAMAIGADEAYDSESMRERVAVENLRVLQYHARLFHKDFKRWPTRVAELDGYVDFLTHRHLLNLQPKSQSALERFKKALDRKKEKPAKSEAESDDTDGIDDSLYEVETDGHRWVLKIRPDEFKQLRTISIDANGNVERVRKDRKARSAGPKP